MQYFTKTMDFERIFPLMGVFDDVVVHVKGPLSCGWEITFPTAYTKTEEEYDDITNCFASALKCLPAWCVVHRQDVYYFDKYKGRKRKSFLSNTYERHFDGRQYLTHKAYVFVTLCSKGFVMKDGSNSGMLGMKGCADVPTDNEFAAFRSKCNEFAAILGNCSNMSLRVLREKDWMGEGMMPGIVQRYFMLGSTNPVISDIKQNHESVSVYDKEAVMMVLSNSDHLPNEISNISKVDALSGISNEVFLSSGARLGINLKCEHVVNQIFVVPSKEEMITAITAEKGEMEKGLQSTDNRINAEERQEFLDDAYDKDLTCIQAFINVVAWDTPERMVDVIGDLSAAVKSLECKAVFNRHTMPLVWYACSPGSAFDVGQENFMRMELKSALCLMPAETFDADVEGGTLQLCDRIRNIPLTIDIQLEAARRHWIGNQNCFVLGSSGSGKSFTVNTLLRNFYENDEFVFVLDVGGSYYGLSHIIYEETGGVDGQYFEFSMEHPLTFNPFKTYRSWFNADGTIRQDEPDINVIFLFLQTVWTPDGGWTSARQSVLRDILMKFIASCRGRKTAPVFDDFFAFVDSEIAPKIKHPLLSDEDIKKRQVIRLTDERKAEASKAKKKFALTTEMMNDIEVEATRWMQEHKEEIEDMKFADARKNGYVIEKAVITNDKFDMDAFIPSIRDYVTGNIYGFLLNEKNPKDLITSRFTVVDLEALQSLAKDANGETNPFYSACVLFITHEFENKMRYDEATFKNFVVDEAWAAIANKTLGPYLQELWRTARKKNCSAMAITQQLSDIKSSPYIRDVIQQNSDVKILLDQKNNRNDFDLIQSLCSLSDQDKNIILSMNSANNPDYNYREVFICLGNNRSAVYGVEVSGEELVAYESNKNKKERFLKMAKLIGYMEAATAIAEENRKKAA